MNKTTQLVKLLQQCSINPNDPHGYVAGYLHAVLERFENEYRSAGVFLDEEIAHITKKLNQEVA